MNWRLYRSITDGNYEIEEFRPAISSFDAHQRECQQLEETEDSQIPLVLEDIDSVFREMVRTPDYFTSSLTWRYRNKKWGQQYCCSALWNLMANIFLDLEDRRWPFEMMRNMWSRTWLTKLLMQELKYANLTCVQVYHKFERGIIFFLTVF